MGQQVFYEFGNATDTGCVRTKNEDSFVLYKAADRRQYMRKGHLALVCDGMGGAQGGRTASTMAVEEISRAYYSSRYDDPRTAITHAIREANSKIFHRSQGDERLKGMGTTVVAVILTGNRAYIAHVGDSRCYLIRNKEISQITEDHTIVQRMVNDGLITGEQARTHPESHVLSRSVGVAENVEIDVTAEPLQMQPGDTLVLCSDGLSGQMADDEILQIAVANTTQHAVEKLISLAKERGGPDNITVQMIRVLSREPENSLDTTTMRTAPLRKAFSGVLLWLLALLVMTAAALAALWYFGVLDLSQFLPSGGGNPANIAPGAR